MKTPITRRALSAALAVALVLCALVVLPLSVSADSSVSQAPVISLADDADLWDGSTLTEPTDPDGDGIYHITQAAEFVYIVRTWGADIANTTGKTFVLDNDLDMNNKSVAGVASGYPFGGTLDGQGHTIANVASSTNWGTGNSYLFNKVTACIKNINFLNCKVGSDQGNVTTTGVIGTLPAGGVVENVHINYGGVSTGTGGGVVTYCSGTVKNCTASGKFYAAKTGAGIVGVLQGDGVVTDCVNYANNAATVSLSGGVGGIVGSIESATATVKNCVNYGNISAVTDYIGGIIGSIKKACIETVIIDNNINYGNVTANGKGSAAGILNISSANDASALRNLTNCINYGDITATAGVAGGIVGKAAACVIFSGCFNHGDITASSYAGGLIGHLNGNDGSYTNRNSHFRISDCGSFGAVTGKYAGSIWGGGYSGTTTTRELTNIVGSGKITTTDSDTVQFGAIGYLADGGGTGDFSFKFTNCYFNTPILQAKADAATISSVTLGGKVYADLTTDAFGALDITSLSGSTAEQYNAEGSLAYAVGVYNRNSTGFAPWVITGTGNNAAPVPVTQLGISGATMSLSSNMALNMKLDASTLAGLTVTNVAFVDAEGNGINAVKDDLGRYSASYVKRAADMAEEMKLHLVITIAGTEYVSTNILTYSPLTYLTNLYADYTGEKQSEANATEVLNVVTAMLGYGAAAETKDSGATTIAAKMTELEITAPTFTEGYTDHISGVVTEDDKTAINNIAQVGATLTGGMELTFTMKNTAYTALSIADFGTFTADENGKITVTGINASMILDTLSLTFTGDGVDGISANFTVGDFLESRRDNADETALAEATILYMMAARAYVLN